MTLDTRELLKFSFLTVAVVAGWFALASVSKNVIVEIVLGWVGLAFLALYWRWLLKKKAKPPKS
jgi:uncharacterized membrane protein YeaQ/YmgE (transglycosylase-associated protein family)